MVRKPSKTISILNTCFQPFLNQNNRPRIGYYKDMSRYLWKKILLYHVRLAEGPCYHAPADWRPNVAYSTPMTNVLKESTTGCWPRIYFSQYRAVVTGWQLTANRISAAGYLRCWTSTRWCGSHPTWCGGMRLHSWYA